MSKEKKYLPLLLADYSYEENGGDRGSMEPLIENGFLDESVSTDEYLDFLFGDNFCNPEYHGKFQKINYALNHPKTIAKLKMSYVVPPEALDFKTETRDLFGIPTVVSEWAKHKVVYKLDRDFFSELIRTENVALPKDIFKTMPFRSMYLDLSDCKEINPIVGAYIYILSGDNLGKVTVYMVTDEGVFFSFYSNFEYDESGICRLPEVMIPSTPFIAYDARPGKGQPSNPTVEKKVLENDRRVEIIRSIVQVLMFLASKEPDIEEDPVTKSTYRPSSTVKNKFSEVQRWNVGVRYGKAIQIGRAESEKRSSVQQYSEPSEDSEPSKRKSPRPHVRCAHWQRYHVGRGRKNTVLLWVPPSFVGGNGEVIATIHKLKKAE